jgi:hypothetical protein
MSTSTHFLDFSRLSRVEGGVTVARIALACDDIASANSAMGRLAESGPALAHVRQGMKMYFCRLQCGHLVEGLEIISEVRKNRALMSVANGCSQTACRALTSLCRCLEDGSDRSHFEQRVIRIRSNVAFHYDPKLFERAIQDRANRKGRAIAMTVGQDIHSSRFEFADYLLDSIVCQQIWGIQEDDAQPEADRIGDWCFKKCINYLDFAGDFVPRFMRNHGVLR